MQQLDLTALTRLRRRRPERLRRILAAVVLAGLTLHVAIVPATAQPTGLLAGGFAFGWQRPAGGSGAAQPVPPAGGAPTTAVSFRQAAATAYTTAGAGSAARIAIAFARAQLGLPYQWGGDGPGHADAGFDCSGLTQAAYAAAAVSIPRTAQTQYDAGPRVAAGVPLEPGDLVFYGTPTRVHHVGLYVGSGQMINAPTFDRPVQVAPYRWAGDDYLAATRPTAGGLTATSAAPAATGPAAHPPTVVLGAAPPSGSTVTPTRSPQPSVSPDRSPSPSPSGSPSPSPSPSGSPSPTPSASALSPSP